MLRRLATGLLVLAVALGGLSTAACAGGRCPMMRQQRLRCCEDGLHAERGCCGSAARLAATQAPATLERPVNSVAHAALPLVPAALAATLVTRGPIAAAPMALSHAPPLTLIAQHTSLLL